MNLYAFSVIIISVLFIPVFFIDANGAIVEKMPFEDLEFYESDIAQDGIYIFVQLTQRDSNGNLIAFIQSDKMSHLNINLLNNYVNERAQEIETPVYDFDGQLVQVYDEKFTEINERDNDITASTMLVIKFYNPETNLTENYLAARFAHDGIIMNTGDVMQTNWNIARLLN